MTDGQPLLLLYLDPYHLGDPLFLRSFAQDLKAHVGPMILVHGSGEEAERSLEAHGLLADIDRSGAQARRLIERAIRDLNRRIVHELTETGISAIGVFGVDRGLLRLSNEGTLEVAKAEWLLTLALQGGIPVIGGLVQGLADDSVEASSADVVNALAAGLDRPLDLDVIAIALTRDRKAGLVRGGALINNVNAKELSAFDSVADMDTVQQIAETVRVRLTSSRSLRGEGLPNGTDLRR